MGLRDGQKSFKRGLAVNTITAYDRDGQTPYDSKDRAMQSVARVMMMAMLHSNGQLRTEKDGDRESVSK